MIVAMRRSLEKPSKLRLADRRIATNAAKYGALSSRTPGREHLRPARRPLHRRLQEIDGHGDVPDSADGFGSKLVKATVEERLNGQIKREWKPAGLAITASRSPTACTRRWPQRERGATPAGTS